MGIITRIRLHQNMESHLLNPFFSPNQAHERSATSSHNHRYFKIYLDSEKQGEVRRADHVSQRNMLPF
jgi:hypothetical protein